MELRLRAKGGPEPEKHNKERLYGRKLLLNVQQALLQLKARPELSVRDVAVYLMAKDWSDCPASAKDAELENLNTRVRHLLNDMHNVGTITLVEVETKYKTRKFIIKQ